MREHLLRAWRSAPFVIGLLPALEGIRVALSPHGIRLVALPVFLFGIIPLLDVLFGRSRVLLEDTPAPRAVAYDVWLWLWVPLQLTALGIALHTIPAGVVDGSVSVVEAAAAALSLGLMSGLGINVAHEFMHRRGAPERAAAELIMTLCTYTHFCVEHVLGHHKHVATPEDPASSRKGESLYAYWPRTLLGGLRSAWNLEGERARKQGLKGLSDRRVRYAVDVAVVYVVAFAVGGAWGVALFAAQSVVAMLLLEAINFIEHYGLARARDDDGRYERCTPHHSWNASERLTNAFLFHLERHADHHHLASRPYYALRHVDDSPQLPTGYAGMIPLALVPPLWRVVMDPRVDAWNARPRAVD
jgi:alkane 1-monooxygenase